MWVLPRKFGSGSHDTGVFPGVQKHQQMVFSHNALLCGTLEVNGPASDFRSGIPSGSEPCPPLELGIIVTVCPCCLQPITALSTSSCRFFGRDSDQLSGCCPECLAVAPVRWVFSKGSKSNSIWCFVAVPSFFHFANP